MINNMTRIANPTVVINMTLWIVGVVGWGHFIARLAVIPALDGLVGDEFTKVCLIDYYFFLHNHFMISAQQQFVCCYLVSES